MTKMSLDTLGEGLEIIEEGRSSNRVSGSEASALRSALYRADWNDTRDAVSNRISNSLRTGLFERVKRALGFGKLKIYSDDGSIVCSYDPYTLKGRQSGIKQLDVARTNGLLSPEKCESYQKVLRSLG